MSGKDSIEELRRLVHQREAAIGWTKLRRVTLGATINGKRYLGAGGTRVWVTTLDKREAFEVERGDANVADAFGREVWIGKPPGQSYDQLFGVVGGNRGASSGTISHAPQHTYTLRWRQDFRDGDGIDPVLIGQHQITDLLVVPDSGFTVEILPGIAKVNGTLVEVEAGTFFALDDSEVPAGAGDAVLCRLEIDSAGAIHDSYGSDYAEPVPDVDALAEAPAATSGRNTIAYIWIPAGATSIERNFILPTSLAERTGGMSGGGATDASDVTYTPDEPTDYPEGVPDDVAEALGLLAARTVGSSTLIYEKWDPDAPPVSPHAGDNEFEGSIGGAWSTWDHGSKFLTAPAASAYGKGVRLVYPQNNDNAQAGIIRANPISGGVDFNVTTCVELSYIPAQFGAGGIAFLDGSGSGDDFYLWIIGRNNTAGNAGVALHYYTDYDSLSSNVLTYNFALPGLTNRVYLRIRRISTNYLFDMSVNGKGWVQLASNTLSNLGTFSHIALVCNNNNNSNGNMYFTFPFIRFSTNTDLDAPVHGQNVGIYAPP